ncbi:MAG: hypothetical protein U0R17_07215 [Acidimicrobiia bacterium]
MTNDVENSYLDDDFDTTALVPTKIAYLCAFIALSFCSILGGFIGYAMMKVFFTSSPAAVISIGTIVICGSITYGVSVITSLGLKASVEWKQRKQVGSNKDRPSNLVRN